MATAKRTSRSRTSDRSRVAGGQAHEVSYESRKTGSTTAQVKRAIKQAGSNMRKAVEAALPGAKKRSAKKASAKKGSARKSSAKKGSAGKRSAKKGSARKGTARKSSAKRDGRKSGARKTAARKSGM